MERAPGGSRRRSGVGVVPSDVARRFFEAAPGLNFNDLEAHTGVHHETVRRYLRKGEPSFRFLAAFCRAFDVSADWIITGLGSMRLSLRREPSATPGGTGHPAETGRERRGAGRVRRTTR